MKLFNKLFINWLMTTIVIMLVSLLAYAKAADQVTLRFRLKVGEEEYFAPVEDFEKEFPNIRIKTETTVGAEYYTKFLVDFAAGVAPDIIWTGDVIMGQYAARGCYVDLTPFIKSGELKMPEFDEATKVAWEYRGKTYALPFDISAKVLFFNKIAFEDAGCAFPTSEWKRDNLLTSAKKLTKTDSSGKVVRYGYAVQPAWWAELFSMIYGNGGGYLNESLTKSVLGRPAAYEGIQWWADLINVHKVSPKVAAAREEPLSARFQDGEIAMMWGSCWDLPMLSKKDTSECSWDITLYPAGKIRRFTFMWSGGSAITTTTKHVEEAIEFLKFYNKPSSLMKLYAIGQFIAPPAAKELQEEWLEVATNSYGERDFKAMLDAISYMGLPEVTSTFYEQMDMLDRELEPVFAGKISAKEAVSKIVPQINTILERGI